MAAQESSALFSLSELMRLEESRIREEEEANRARLLAEERARREAERAEQEREAECRRQEEASRREEDARLEAVRRAEVERVRLEAEQRARIEELSLRQDHERKLATLQTEARSRGLSRALGWTIGLSIALTASATGYYALKLRPAAEQKVASLESLIDNQRQETEKTKRALDDQSTKLRELEDQLQKAHERAVGAIDGQKAPKSQQAPHKGDRRHAQPPPPPCVCADPHDPLCGCLR